MRPCELHIQLVQVALSVGDWSELMKKPNRLKVVVTAASPPDLRKSEFIDGGPYSWIELLSNHVGIASDIWPDASEEEIKVKERIRSIARQWIELQLWESPKDQMAEALRQELRKLVE